MIMKGQKRKLSHEDVEVSDRSGASWESQRQFVFYVSLNKYQRGQELPEPSLRRSVLIANTLRQISLEAAEAPPVDVGVSSPPSPCGPAASPVKERESIAPRMAAPNCPAAVAVATCPLAASNHQSVASNSAPSRSLAGCSSSAVNFSRDDDEEDWGSMSADPDFSLSAAISSILTALDSTIDGQAVPRTPLRSLENLTALAGGPEGDAAWAKQGVKGHWGGSWERQEECSMEGMRSSYLGDLAVEDLFQDIDTSLLERDMGALGVRGGGGVHSSGDDLLRYLPPLSSPSSSFSLSFNQNLKCLPSFSSFSPSSSSPSSSPLSSPSACPFSSQSHTREGLELEHLMEILVES
ncbi:SERTA domain-containing protein 3 [Myripristis murdjan]|uniref:SERTA domain-containing protein n=1 Tax=Myripristis murdjan TaxID=586833 RepID=A0A667ZUE3_9TELE|nr:SERTA domain-containing protein 3 [Myripristis murdjan]XP_029922208.1 SERTA domain-containing protein 3 [Myripristis murdjan]